MVGEKRLNRAIDRLAEAYKEYALARIKRIQKEERLEFDYLERYLAERAKEKTTEAEARARAKLQLQDDYIELAKLRADEIAKEAIVELRKRQLSVYQDIYRKIHAKDA